MKIQIRNDARTRELKFIKIIDNIFEKCFKELKIVMILLSVIKY